MYDLTPLQKWYEIDQTNKIFSSPNWREKLKEIIIDLVQEQCKLNFPPQLYELCKCLINRETAFCGFGEDEEHWVRYLKIHSIRYLMMRFEFEGFFKRPTNIYHSVNLIDRMPTMSYKKEEREQQKIEFETTFMSKLIDVDFVIDLDPQKKSMFDNKLLEQAMKLIEYLDKFDMHYSIRASGKGIHIYLPGYQFKIPAKEKNKLYYTLTNELRDIMGFDYIDPVLYSTEEHTTRVIKAAYSIDAKTGHVCLPLTKEQLSTLTPDKLKVDYVLTNQNLFKRGIILNNSDRTPKTEEFTNDILRGE